MNKLLGDIAAHVLRGRFANPQAAASEIPFVALVVHKHDVVIPQQDAFHRHRPPRHE